MGEFRRKMKKHMRFDLVTYDPDAMLNIIVRQQRDQAVIEANAAECRPTAKRRHARSIAAAGIQPHESGANEHNSRENDKANGVKAEGNRRYDNNERFVFDKQEHKLWAFPQSQQKMAGKGVHGQSHGQTPIQQRQSTNGPAQHTRSNTTGTATAFVTLRASGY